MNPIQSASDYAFSLHSNPRSLHQHLGFDLLLTSSFLIYFLIITENIYQKWMCGKYIFWDEIIPFSLMIICVSLSRLEIISLQKFEDISDLSLVLYLLFRTLKPWLFLILFSSLWKMSGYAVCPIFVKFQCCALVRACFYSFCCVLLIRKGVFPRERFGKCCVIFFQILFLYYYLHGCLLDFFLDIWWSFLIYPFEYLTCSIL